MKGSPLVAGASSDAGKSLLTAGICRWLARQGVDVARFKGAEHVHQLDGDTRRRRDRPYACYAGACLRGRGVGRHEPVLLKSGGDRTTHVVLMRQPHSEAGALSYRERKTTLRQAVLDSYDRLRARHDVVNRGMPYSYGRPLGPHPTLLDIAELIVVDPYFLFPGVLPDRVVAQTEEFAARRSDVSITVAEVLGDSDELVDLVFERDRVAIAGDIRMNCDTCMYRIAMPGFAVRVGQEQDPHHHPADDAHNHGHDHDRPRVAR